MLIYKEESSPNEEPEPKKEKSSLKEFLLATVPRDELQAALDALRPQEKRLMEMCLGFADGKLYTEEELAAEFNITREHVRRKETRALRGFLCHVNFRTLKDGYLN